MLLFHMNQNISIVKDFLLKVTVLDVKLLDALYMIMMKSLRIIHFRNTNF